MDEFRFVCEDGMAGRRIEFYLYAGLHRSLQKYIVRKDSESQEQSQIYLSYAEAHLIFYKDSKITLNMSVYFLFFRRGRNFFSGEKGGRRGLSRGGRNGIVQ